MQVKTLKQLFQRYRRPGHFFFATMFLMFSFFLVSQIDNQTVWKPSKRLVSQPAFWPMVSLYGMAFFAALNWLSSAVSPRIPGRWLEVMFWLRSFEYVAWFMVYVFIVPQLGYLPTTVLFAMILTFRVGCKAPQLIAISAFVAVGIVLIFKTFLQVNVPSGLAYEYLPHFMRSFMLTYF